MQLRYGMNPHQSARIVSGGDHVRAVHGSPSLINYLDALNAGQLVAEAARATGRVAAASFKHVSPAGAALAGSLDETMRDRWGLGADAAGPVTAAYVRARDADPRSSYGDMIAVSEPVDQQLAALLATVVSDGIIAPGYEPGTVAALSRKKGGRFVVFEIDPTYEPPAPEVRTVLGVTFEQERDHAPIGPDLLQVTGEGRLGPDATADALLGLVAARYTQSNSVVYVRDGMSIGIGAGQQSRIDCTRLAGDKAREWWLRRDSGPLTGATLVSDGYIPFRDNIDVAAAHGVEVVVEPGGSLRSDEVAEACHEHRITLVRTGLRLFHH
ncbi:5-aminoimidazole-4-carboxamide ribonucleotide transformylase [Nocardia stercoris]|uniref:5-aminoimidazole-4-carboxamide ribonucleotide transformylase n=1 Tax=Nocardia stercoris TaxID=2483361 RepID=A0A3M2L7D5_9NOCA|nr:5-aminoimidazole-4-carboxamide ribonucleotide transformylase [Nocardia stercoris]RMI33447.1 5-aminoimidazole-4-carboxamide ribonucleotide transformylase [Nocardia stercoris]